MQVVTIFAFAEEISPDLTERLDILESEETRHLEFRGLWKKNVLRLERCGMRITRTE